MKTLCTWLLVSWKLLTGRISVEKLEALLGSDVLTPKVTMFKRDEVIAIYPDWVKRHLTPNFETGKSTGVVNPTLVFHPKQIVGQPINGHAIYAWLLERNQLPLCIELADLQWWEKHPNEIPEEFTGKFVYAWASAALDIDGRWCVPCLACRGSTPVVIWVSLDNDQENYELIFLS